jgi:hypothetical protein
MWVSYVGFRFFRIAFYLTLNHWSLSPCSSWSLSLCSTWSLSPCSSWSLSPCSSWSFWSASSSTWVSSLFKQSSSLSFVIMFYWLELHTVLKYSCACSPCLITPSVSLHSINTAEHWPFASLGCCLIQFVITLLSRSRCCPNVRGSIVALFATSVITVSERCSVHTYNITLSILIWTEAYSF